MLTEWQLVDESVSQELPDPRPHLAADPVVSLTEARVLVLGCGSVGGLAAWALAGAGVGTLVLADRDRLEADNLRRHVCPVGALGKPKAAAVARFLRGRFPAMTAEPHDLDFLADPDALRRLIGAAEAVLTAVDAEGPKHLIDAMARELGKPVVYAGVYGGGWAGEVIRSDAAAGTPCYACAARALGRVGIPVFPVAAGPAYALPAAGVPESSWARADLTSLMPVASLAVRVVVARLALAYGHGRPLGELTSGEASAWRLPLRAVPGWGGPWALRPVTVPRFHGCQTCTAEPVPCRR